MRMFLYVPPFLPPVATHICIYLVCYQNDIVHKLFGVSTPVCFLCVWDVGVEPHTDSKETFPENSNHILGQWARPNVGICILKSLRDDLLHG